MKRLLFLSLFAVALSGCELQGGEPVTRTEIGSGSETRVALRREVSACEVVIFEDVPLTHCVADPVKHNISTVLADPNGTPYRSLKTYGEGLELSQYRRYQLS